MDATLILVITSPMGIINGLANMNINCISNVVNIHEGDNLIKIHTVRIFSICVNAYRWINL